MASTNRGEMADADAVGQAGTPGEGPFATIWLKTVGERIVQTGFETHGCPYSVACAAWLTQWATGKTREEALVLDAGDLMKVLGGLPLGKEHCAVLAVNALRDGLQHWQQGGEG
jgi:nitrogen fixation NifU-like protein